MIDLSKVVKYSIHDNETRVQSYNQEYGSPLSNLLQYKLIEGKRGSIFNSPFHEHTKFCK